MRERERKKERRRSEKERERVREKRERGIHGGEEERPSCLPFIHEDGDREREQWESNLG